MAHGRQHNHSGASTCSRCARGSNGRNSVNQEVGFSTKVHATTDALGCPTRFILAGGNASDYTQAIPLIDGQGAEKIVADKGYDSQAIIDAIEAKRAEPVIPPRRLRKTQRKYDRYIYKERNVIERIFNKLKQFRRVSSRYDKLATSFLSFLHPAAIAVWLK